MRRLATCLLFMIAASALLGASRCGASGTVAGGWTAVAQDGDRERFQFSMNLDHDGNVGRGYARTDFSGLTLEQVNATASTPVAFELRREPGTVGYEGSFKNGRGAGDFSFAPDLDFPKRLAAVGVAWETKHGDEAQLLFQLATNDMTIDFIRSMQAIGYREDLQTYIQFRIFRVDPAYVRAMDDVGFKHLSAQKLVETKIHGATPEYIRDMRAHGEDLSLDDCIQSRIFQVTPEFADDMRQLGYANLSHDTLVAFRIHGVTGDFIRELKQLGYANVSADDLVAMRIHGVTPSFIRKAGKAAHHRVSIDRLIEMRIFGIEAGDAT